MMEINNDLITEAAHVEIPTDFAGKLNTFLDSPDGVQIFESYELFTPNQNTVNEAISRALEQNVYPDFVACLTEKQIKELSDFIERNKPAIAELSLEAGNLESGTLTPMLQSNLSRFRDIRLKFEALEIILNIHNLQNSDQSSSSSKTLDTLRSRYAQVNSEIYGKYSEGKIVEIFSQSRNGKLFLDLQNPQKREQINEFLPTEYRDVDLEIINQKLSSYLPTSKDNLTPDVLEVSELDSFNSMVLGKNFRQIVNLVGEYYTENKKYLDPTQRGKDFNVFSMVRTLERQIRQLQTHKLDDGLVNVIPVYFGSYNCTVL